MDHPADLINVALETLIRERFELPAFSTLDRLTRRIRAIVNQGLFAQTLARLAPEDRQRLDALLERAVNPSRAPYPRSARRHARTRRGRHDTLEMSSPPEAPYGGAHTAFQRLKDPPLNPTLTHLQQQQDLL
jgi:hypothetical protein